MRDMTAKAHVDSRSYLMREMPLLSIVKIMKMKKRVKILLILRQFEKKKDWGDQALKREKKMQLGKLDFVMATLSKI